MLFNKWLKDQEDKEKNKSHDEDSLKDVDEFLDAEDEDALSNDIVTKENALTTLSLIDTLEKESSSENLSESVPNVILTIEEKNSEQISIENELKTDDIKMILPEVLNTFEEPLQLLLPSTPVAVSKSSPRGSTNDLSKKHVCHNKGKAPIPPSPSNLTVTQLQDQKMSSAGSNETISEKCDEKKPKKTLMNYLPSILKPISPSNSSKNIPKETDI